MEARGGMRERANGVGRMGPLEEPFGFFVPHSAPPFTARTTSEP